MKYQLRVWALTSELPSSATNEIHARDILKTREQMNRILAERTGQPLEKIARDTERDYFLTADEARDYGLVDNVISKRG